MNLSFSRRDFERLPYREDVVFEPLQGEYYRSRHWPKDVFIKHGSWWACFRVEIEEDRR
jgi:hypothetical protein